MEGPDATGGGACRWLCLERQDLSQLVQGCLRHYRHTLERPEILRPAGQAIEEIVLMTTLSAKRVRCAIYTRVSTDQGLEQDFNSLDAQYDASLAYIRSQAHAGWTLLRAKYDDGGFSGGNTDRPALQRLLEDVRVGKVDVIVVYKVDRLTRSLADFAKLVADDAGVGGCPSAGRGGGRCSHAGRQPVGRMGRLPYPCGLGVVFHARVR